MNKVEKIREEIKKRYEYWKEKESNSHSIESESRMSECNHLLSMIISDGCIPDYIDLKHANDDTFMDVDNERFINDFKNYMKGE